MCSECSKLFISFTLKHDQIEGKKISNDLDNVISLRSLLLIPAHSGVGCSSERLATCSVAIVTVTKERNKAWCGGLVRWPGG